MYITKKTDCFLSLLCILRKPRRDFRLPTSDFRLPTSRKSEVGSRKSEVRSRKSEVGSPKSEVRSRKSEVGSRKSLLGFRSISVKPFFNYQTQRTGKPITETDLFTGHPFVNNFEETRETRPKQKDNTNLAKINFDSNQSFHVAVKCIGVRICTL